MHVVVVMLVAAVHHLRCHIVNRAMAGLLGVHHWMTHVLDGIVELTAGVELVH